MKKCRGENKKNGVFKTQLELAWREEQHGVVYRQFHIENVEPLDVIGRPRKRSQMNLVFT